MPKVLIVDDEANLLELIQSYLEKENYQVLTANNGVTALDLARLSSPDLVILDLMLPGLDGLEVCRQLRQFSDAYVVMLTAKAEEVDKIVGLSLGADDYITKPFSPRELVARIKARFRRPRSGDASQGTASAAESLPPPRQFGKLQVDEARHEVEKSGIQIALTAHEFDLLATLTRYPGRVFTRNQLLEQVWGDEYYDDHVVDVHVANLRKKIETDSTHPEYVETIRGVGYRFNPKTGVTP
ncbi:MAG: response regulator transcription factor [Chloroflexi bacterium]|nr:response regulator transcription factor [Chloroflexota bacterium]OJV92868.1 MAG: DNA-binding response regulator [Chloroflexi bacterium 54-19]